MWSWTSNKAWHGPSGLFSSPPWRKWIPAFQRCPLEERENLIWRRIQDGAPEWSDGDLGARTRGFLRPRPGTFAGFAFLGISGCRLPSLSPKWHKTKCMFANVSFVFVSSPWHPSVSACLFLILYSRGHFCSYRGIWCLSRWRVARPLVGSLCLVDCCGGSILA